VARPRRALHRAFARFLAENRSRLAIEVHLGERTDAVWNFSFVGVTGIISGWINTFEVTVAANWDGEAWDLILDLDAYPVHVEGGYMCRICRPSALFPSREALWADHLFEPFLAWVNDALAPFPWLELVGTADSGFWSAIMRRERGQDHSGEDRSPMRHVPVRTATCGGAPHG